MTNLIIAAAVALAIGLVLGLLIGRSGNGPSLRQRRAEQQIEELRSEYTRYQAQVNEHFMESADLMRRLNDSYRDVNEHMARGANRLCNDEDWLDQLERDKAGSPGESLEPPRDYALRKDPEEKGTLAEDFGLANGGSSKE
jgi:uncharacterized membrane-anchored protein YhcB (DUF1043 family)